MRTYKHRILWSVISFLSIMVHSSLFAQKVLIPMDLAQTDHLKAYGLTYWALTKNVQTEWLLNYRGGSFLLDAESFLIAECRIRGVSFEQLSSAQAQSIYTEVQSEKTNMDVIKLEKPPRIAVYTPPGSRPWDDAVTMVLEYAEVKYDKIWDEEVLREKLSDYDWLHLHHEDFTGQYGKFFANYATAPWYIQQVTLLETTAKKLGFKKVSELKRAIVQKIRAYIEQGGFMFAMCSATDSYDIALAAAKTDICETMFDGDPVQAGYENKIDFTQTFAFENFEIYTDPYRYEYSSIDVDASFRVNNASVDYFTLFDFSAKYDPVPTMLTQCHANIIKNFLGQTTAFHKEQIKKSVTVLAEREGTDEVKYLHGNIGRGTFTWYGGHDPEDYQHAVGDPPTDISLHKNSPGYRLILNNILFPAAKKKKQKT
ncbi:MAG: asparagine synthetase B [Candidatus Kapaibacteriota bacterium]